MYGGDSSHLPLKINSAGVIPAIFASALLLLPVTFSNFNVSQNETFLNISSYFSQGQPLYMLLYASGIIFFTFFYTSITFNPTETAENLRKYGGFIPGIRPGESTAIYIDTILTRLNNNRCIISCTSLFNARISNCKLSYSFLFRWCFSFNCCCCCN